ncbi:DUF2637 domain-containing protein [Streptomyces sp. NPDC003635]
MGLIASGTVVIAGIGFAGSYAAVHELALHKKFGAFSHLFPIGVDAGICVLLALDLLLTRLRIPFPLLRQTAWLLTAATITFNAAAAWPDPLGVSMHAVIPVLFVVTVEAARHAIGRLADVASDQHQQGIRLARWLLSPLPTFLLWRRMKLWELRSYEQMIKREQQRLTYQTRLRSRYGRAWRRKAPAESLLPLKLAKYGIPLPETNPPDLETAGTASPPLHRPPMPEPASGASDTPPAHPGRHPTSAQQQSPHPQPQTRRHQQAQHEPVRPAAPTSPAAPALTPSTEPSPPHQPTASPGPAGHTTPHQTSHPLTQVDRYYQAWHAHHTLHGHEPTPRQLSTILTQQGIRTRHGLRGHEVSGQAPNRVVLSKETRKKWRLPVSTRRSSARKQSRSR